MTMMEEHGESIGDLDTMDSVSREHGDAGFPTVTKPSVPAPTETLGALVAGDAEGITEEFIKNQAWASYIIGLLAQVNAVLTQVSNQALCWQYKLTAAYRETSTEWAGDELKAILWSDARHVGLVERRQRLMQQKLLLEAELARLRGNLTLISRLVTVRGQELQLSGRSPRKVGRK